MTSPDRSRIRISRNATTPARLPAIVTQGVTDQATRAALDAIKETLEVMRGARGNPWEKVVTTRDLEDLGVTAFFASTPGGVSAGATASAGTVVVRRPSGFALQPIEDFAAQIRATQLFRDLLKRIDDPSRFDDLPEQVKAVLLTDLAKIAAARGADIQRIEKKVQDATESLALQATQLTAAFKGNTAAVQQTQFAFADATRATAGVVETVTAGLAGITGEATVETTMVALADLFTGLLAQYTVKVTAGGAMAGYGLSATDNGSGHATSAFLIAADKFAIVPGSYAGGLTTTPPAGSVPFGVDAITGNVYMSSNLLVGGTITSSGINVGSGNFQVNASTGGVLAFDFVGSNSVFNNAANPGLPSLEAVANGFATTAVAAYAHSPSTVATSHGFRGSNTHFGTSGIVGSAGSFDFVAEGHGTYGPFTGAHQGLMARGTEVVPGDILVDVGNRIDSRGISDSIFVMEYSTVPMQRGKRGVITATMGPLAEQQPNSMVHAITHTTDADGNDVSMPIMSATYYEMADTHDVVTFNGVGDGLINVCGEAGDIDKDDLITTSSTSGKGMLQRDESGTPDTIVRRYTVAQAREPVTFADPTEVKLVACIYMCG